MSLCPVPIIAAVSGVAITGGFELALGADTIVAAENASFRDTHVTFGVAPAYGISQKLPRMVRRRPWLHVDLSPAEPRRCQPQWILRLSPC